MMVEDELEKLGLHHTHVELGDVIIREHITTEQRELLICIYKIRQLRFQLNIPFVFA